MRAFTVVLLGLTVTGVALAQDFKPYASGAGRYKVLFPGAVKTETNDIVSGKDMLKLTLDVVELKGNTSFMVTYVDTPDEIAKKPVGPRLDKVRDGNKGESGKVLEEKDITLGTEKYPGRDLLIETPGGFIRNRVVIADKRLYQVMVFGSKEVVSSESADKFIASFEITK